MAVNVSSNVTKSLTAALRVPPSYILPLFYFKKWELHDFHTSSWTRVNPSAQIKRTRLGRSIIDQPVMDMVSVNRYGGNAKRASLVRAFRVYRSVDQSEASRSSGVQALREVKFTDLAIEAGDEENDVAIDFACLYFNACVLFGVHPAPDIMVQLPQQLGTVLKKPFHWECVLSALHAMLRPHFGNSEAGAANREVSAAAAFIDLMKHAAVDTVPDCLSRDGLILLLLTASRVIALRLCSAKPDTSDELQYLLNLQAMAVERLSSHNSEHDTSDNSNVRKRRSPTAAREELLAVVDAICWRHAAGGAALPGDSVRRFLVSGGHAALPSLHVQATARLFCAMCAVFAERDDAHSALDPLVRHMERHTRVHGAAEAAVVLAGLKMCGAARRRYVKFPTALLDYLRDERQRGAKVDEGLPALELVISELATGDDELADMAEAVAMDLSPSRRMEYVGCTTSQSDCVM